jgi:hypothetical protein
MTLKDALNGIVTELEKIGALTSALQRVIISKDPQLEATIAEDLPKIQENYRKHLEGIYLAISELRD